MTFENVSTKKSLRDRAKEFSTQLPLMTDRTKGDAAELLGHIVTVQDFGFLAGDNGHDYVAFIVDAEPKKFYFGGTVLTDQMHKLDDEGYGEEIRAEGLPMLLTERKSKNGRTYTNVEFYPGE